MNKLITEANVKYLYIYIHILFTLFYSMFNMQ